MREPETPQRALNNDNLEKSLRRQNASNISISDIARRIDSPLHQDRGRDPRGPPSLPTLAQSLNPVNNDEFQEWMKMVRTKRVKTSNAFTIQLIDAFYSMVQGHVLSNSGSRYSFQEVTHTLGGCLTVYKNRIARVKDDTSRLLVGVAEKEGETGEPTGSPEEQLTQTRATAASKRLHQTGDPYLVPANKLQIDAGDLKSAIDPLLRKMSADFDKRGAGALLQYSLRCDQNGRLLLDAETEAPAGRNAASKSRGLDTSADASEDANANANASANANVSANANENASANVSANANASANANVSANANENENASTNAENGAENDVIMENTMENANTDASEDANAASEDANEVETSSLTPGSAALGHFRLKYFNLDPSLETLPLVDSLNHAMLNPKEATSLAQEMQAWALGDTEVKPDVLPEDAKGFNVAMDVANDEWGAAEPIETAPLSEEADELRETFENGEGVFANAENHHLEPKDELADDIANLSIASVISSRMPTDGNWQSVEYLRSLDNQKQNWAGASHWKVQRLHQTASQQRQPATAKRERTRAEVPSSKIDFDQEVDLKSLLATSSRSINLPKNSYQPHTLPTDAHFTTEGLTSLYQLPDAGIANAFRKGPWRTESQDDDAGVMQGTSNEASFYNSGGDVTGGEGFGAPEQYYDWESKPETAADLFHKNPHPSAHGGSQLNFARVAKRVDVRKLKQNVWSVIEQPLSANSQSKEKSEGSELDGNEKDGQQLDGGQQEGHHEHRIGLLDIIRRTQPLYNEAQRAELSPAMYFVSLLHLSNEKGLRIENTPGYTDVNVVVG